jgi:hypothetical protein
MRVPGAYYMFSAIKPNQYNQRTSSSSLDRVSPSSFPSRSLFGSLIDGVGSLRASFVAATSESKALWLSAASGEGAPASPDDRAWGAASGSQTLRATSVLRQLPPDKTTVTPKDWKRPQHLSLSSWVSTLTF